MASEENVTSVYFKGETNNVRIFNGKIKTFGLKTKDVYNAFLLKFNENSDEALKFLGIKIA